MVFNPGIPRNDPAPMGDPVRDSLLIHPVRKSPLEVLFNTNINRMDRYRIGDQIYESMIQEGLRLNEDSFHDCIMYLVERGQLKPKFELHHEEYDTVACWEALYELERVTLPEARVAWGYINETLSLGRTVVDPAEVDNLAAQFATVLSFLENGTDEIIDRTQRDYYDGLTDRGNTDEIPELLAERNYLLEADPWDYPNGLDHTFRVLEFGIRFNFKCVSEAGRVTNIAITAEIDTDSMQNVSRRKREAILENFKLLTDPNATVEDPTSGEMREPSSYRTIESLATPIPEIELGLREFTGLDDGREGLLQGLYCPFKDWRKQALEVFKSAEYRNWPAKAALENLAPLRYWKIEHQYVKELLFSLPDVRAEIEQKISAGRLENTFSLLGTSNALGHLPRLFTHTNAPACHEFGLALLRYIDEIEPEQIRSHTVIPQSLDGNNAMQFYTFAPYIYQDLIERGLFPEEAFDAVLSWSMARVEINDRADASYPGIMAANIRSDFRLAKNGDHPSHAFAQRVGTHIGEALFSALTSEQTV